MKLEDIWKLQSVSDQISHLKKRDTPLPNREHLWDDWEPMRHEIVWNKDKYPENKIIVKDGYKDDKGVYHEPILKDDPINRIPLPIEQDIVNTHVAFTVGKEPTLTCESGDTKEQELFKVVKAINRANKTRFLNKKIVRSWLSEQEVAEYWYVDKDTSFWTKLRSKIKNSIGLKDNVVYKLKVAIWSPFRGDKLYPKFNENHKLVAFCREYRVRNDDNSLTTKFMYIDDKVVRTVNDINNPVWKEFKHGFGKIPVIYSYRPTTLCKNIKPIRERLEKQKSKFADCIDYNFAPRMVVEGDITGRPTKNNGDIVKIEGGGKVYYLSWNQTPAAVKFEFDSLMQDAYGMTHTPRMTVESLQGLAGTSFNYVFMPIHLAVDNHAEVIGEHIQRRTNFQISAIGGINAYYSDVAKTTEIDAELTEYKVEDMKANIEAATEAVAGGVASKKTGIILAGIVDNVEEEMKEMQEEEKKEKEMQTPKVTLKEVA
jgi:hypothetical protein